MLKYYENTATGAGTANVWASISTASSFYKALGSTYVSYLLNGGGEAPLVNGGLQYQGLYAWNPANVYNGSLAPELEIATSYTLNPTNGDMMVSTQVEPFASPTPIPPSVLLLGSGLLGLIGIKRRELFGH